MRESWSLSRGRLAALAGVAVALAAIVAGSGAAALQKKPPAKTLWASPSGSGSACTANAPCSLAGAVSAAGAGATVRAARGTYQGGIVIDKALQLVGQKGVVLDASGSASGVGITITASNVVVDSFTVEKAKFEGILVTPAAPTAGVLSNVTIDHSTVMNNDTGYAAQADGECKPAPPVPGDCGEGIHLRSVTKSTVEHSTVTGNAGGILVTDEFGMTSNNVIAHNIVRDNTHDCGITIASHTPNGIVGNTIEYNASDRNGRQGEGAGILLAGGGPNTRVSDNVIRHNEISGNGLSGITIHLHVPGSNLNGNTIEFNMIGNNNLNGDDDAGNHSPTDILVWATNGGSITGTTITHNVLGRATYGIWTKNAAVSEDHNAFLSIPTPVSQS